MLISGNKCLPLMVFAISFFKSIPHTWMTLQFPNMFTFFVSTNPLTTLIKEARIDLMLINFQEEEIES